MVLFDTSFCVSILGVVNLYLSSAILVREQNTMGVACKDGNGSWVYIILKQQTHVFNPLILDFNYNRKSNLMIFN